MLTLNDLAATSGTASKHVLESTKALAVKKKKKTKTGVVDGAEEGGGMIAAPLATATERRAQREVAYAAAQETATSWDEAVSAEAKADYLNFGSKKQRPTSSAELQSKFYASTPLERRIEKILEVSGTSTEKSVVRREVAALTDAGVEAKEIAARQKELSKTRNLLFYAERKAKYHSKIKSKAYARTRKKRAAKEERKARKKERIGPKEEKAARKARKKERKKKKRRREASSTSGSSDDSDSDSDSYCSTPCCALCAVACCARCARARPTVLTP